MRFVAAAAAIAFSVMAGTPAYATECNCRIELPVDSTGPGTCRKTQDGSQFCKLDWDAGGNRAGNARVMNELRQRGFKSEFDGETAIEQAAQSLLQEIGPRTASAMSVLMAASLVQHAPERLQLAERFLAKYNGNPFLSGGPGQFPAGQDSLSRDTLVAGDRTYNIVLTLGCAQARDRSFFLMIKTRFATQRSDCDEQRR